MTLSKKEKKRIEDEERYRSSIRAEIKKEKKEDEKGEKEGGWRDLSLRPSAR